MIYARKHAAQTERSATGERIRWLKKSFPMIVRNQKLSQKVLGYGGGEKLLSRN